MGTIEDRDAWTSFVLLERFRGGDESAAEALFTRYFERLGALARRRLTSRLARRMDPEDVVLSVYRSFFVDARQGRFVLGRDGDLWRLLSSIAVHKLLKRVRRESAGRRSFAAEVSLDSAEGGRIPGRRVDPSPEDALALADELEQVFSRLDPFARRVLELRLQGLKIGEIAEDSGRSERSVRRALTQIRVILADRFQVNAETHEASPARPDPAVSWLSHRDFLLRRWIGAGMMGKVYEAHRHDDGRIVAVKFLRKSLLPRPSVVRRFLDEARTATGLCHPNIVGAHGLGRTPGGSYFIVMDLVAGSDLSRATGGRPVAESLAVEWSLGICDALAHAHERGIVHCDLKPANILLDENGRVRVTDFGLARSLAGDPQGTARVEGTAPFMAPEQASRSWGRIDERTDVYGIGVVLFALLPGRAPHVGRNLPDVLAQVVGPTPVVSPASLRPGLAGPLVEVCMKCLFKDPEDRFRSVQQVRTALAVALAWEPPSS